MKMKIERKIRNYKDVFRDFWDGNEIIYQSYQCFMCQKWEAVDIHHISAKGMGGSKCKDYIENLTALCRACHTRCHSNKTFNAQVRIKTLEKITDKLKTDFQRGI